jgi:hypothetical protein
MEMGTPAHGVPMNIANRFNAIHPPVRRLTDNKEQHDG